MADILGQTWTRFSRSSRRRRQPLETDCARRACYAENMPNLSSVFDRIRRAEEHAEKLRVELERYAALPPYRRQQTVTERGAWIERVDLECAASGVAHHDIQRRPPPGACRPATGHREALDEARAAIAEWHMRSVPSVGSHRVSAERNRRAAGMDLGPSPQRRRPSPGSLQVV